MWTKHQITSLHYRWYLKSFNVASVRRRVFLRNWQPLVGSLTYSTACFSQRSSFITPCSEEGGESGWRGGWWDLWRVKRDWLSSVHIFSLTELELRRSKSIYLVVQVSDKCPGALAFCMRVSKGNISNLQMNMKNNKQLMLNYKQGGDNNFWCHLEVMMTSRELLKSCQS